MSEPTTEIIRKCLTSCTGCTGRYISDILGKRFICCCPCHYKKSLRLHSGEIDVYENGFLNSSVIGDISYNQTDRANDYRHQHRYAQKMNKDWDHGLPFSVTCQLESTLRTRSGRCN